MMYMCNVFMIFHYAWDRLYMHAELRIHLCFTILHWPNSILYRANTFIISSLPIPLSSSFLYSNGRFPSGIGDIVNETLQFDLPDNIYACDIAVITIWCKSASVQFTALDISPDLFVSLLVCIITHVYPTCSYIKDKQ